MWIDEDGWDCTTVNNKSQWTRWSNGVVDSEEEWDDDNSTSGDGWSSTCKIESGNTWSHSSGGADKCTKQSFMDQKQVQSSQSATQAAMGVGFAASLLNISAPQGMYAMLGIFRMMIILPFIGAQMSKDVITYLTGLNFVMWSFSFLPVEKAPVLGSIIGYFDHSQENSMLSDFKIKSSSTFVNHFNIALIIVMVVIFHMMILMIYALSKKWSKLATSNIFPSVYLRVCIELSISVYLNGFVEIYQMKLSNGSRIISFCITLVVVLSLITVNIVAFYKWIMLVKNQPTGTRFEEFFKGLKVSNTAYLYTVFIMMRRMLSIMIVTVCTSLPMYVKVVMFVIVQLVAWLYIVIVRPFNATKNNIIEVLNESIYLVLSLSLLYYNEINWWDTVTSSIVIQTLLWDSLIIALICMISFCILTKR